MSNMQLKFVTINMFSMRLIKIDLSQNKIASLPVEIVKISTLMVLNCEGNTLSDLPPELWRLSNLREINVSNNKLKSFPVRIEWL